MYAAALGHPIGHSRSPVLHNAAYRALGLADWSFGLTDCVAAQLPGVLAGSGSDCAGYGVTMPNKRAALGAAVHVTDTAAIAGAANTLLPGPDGWTADNTDVIGIVRALEERRIDASAGPVVVLGAGGAAQAALVALAGLGVTGLSAAVRAPDRAGKLQETAQRLGLELQLRPLGPDSIVGAALVVSALPSGVADELIGGVVDAMPGGARSLLDMVYAPWPTNLAAAFLRAGGLVAGGHLMLLHQAARQVELMTGRPAPVEAMRAALFASMGLKD